MIYCVNRKCISNYHFCVYRAPKSNDCVIKHFEFMLTKDFTITFADENVYIECTILDFNVCQTKIGNK